MQEQPLRDLYAFISYNWSLHSFEDEVSRQPKRFKMCGKALLYQALWNNKESYFFFIENQLNQTGSSIRPVELWSWIPTFLIQIHIDRREIPFTLLTQLFSRESVMASAKQYPLAVLWPDNYRFYRKMSENCDPETILFWCNYTPSPMPKRLSLLFRFTSQNDHSALQFFESKGLIQSSLNEYPKDHTEFPFLFFVHEQNLNFILRYFPLLDIIHFSQNSYDNIWNGNKRHRRHPNTMHRPSSSTQRHHLSDPRHPSCEKKDRRISYTINNIFVTPIRYLILYKVKNVLGDGKEEP